MKNPHRTLPTPSRSRSPLVCAFTVLCAGLTLAGCAFDVIQLKQTPARLEPISPQPSAWRLEKDATGELGTSFPTRLKAGTKWEAAGRIEQGDVFRTGDQIVTVEASNIHEAQVVLKEGKLVGFYLPIEKTFTPVRNPVPLTIVPLNNINTLK